MLKSGFSGYVDEMRRRRFSEQEKCSKAGFPDVKDDYSDAVPSERYPARRMS